MKRRSVYLISVIVVAAAVLAACGGSAGSSGIARPSARTEAAVVRPTKPAVLESPTSAGRTAMPDPSTVSAEADRQSFLMRIDDAFAIKGRGTVVTGRVARGTVRAGDEVKIIDSHDKMLKTVVTGVEMLHKVLDQAAAGDNVGILLRGIEVDDVKPDMVLAAAESFTSYAEALLALDAAGSSSEPPAASGGSFLMRIDDVFAIKGRGTVVVGRVARGTTQTGSEVEIFGPQSETRKTIITGIEMLRKTQDQATAGDNVGILLHGIEANEVTPGMIVAQSGSFTSYAEALRELK